MLKCTFTPPAASWLGRLDDDPAVDLLDQTALFGRGQEPTRRDDRAVVVDHPHQQLMHHDPAAVHVDN
jgi:hypothetical protein